MVEATWTLQRLGLRPSVSVTCWVSSIRVSLAVTATLQGRACAQEELVRKNKLKGIFVKLLFCFALFFSIFCLIDFFVYLF